MTEAEYQRFLRLPVMLANTRRKLKALECEAERYGLHDLLKPEKRA